MCIRVCKAHSDTFSTISLTGDRPVTKLSTKREGKVTEIKTTVLISVTLVLRTTGWQTLNLLKQRKVSITNHSESVNAPWSSSKIKNKLLQC